MGRFEDAPEVNAAGVLIVDDEPGVRDVFCEMLHGAGWEIVTAANVVQAKTALTLGNVDVIVSDIRMPGADGTELLRFVREAAADIPVILITGAPAIETAREAVRLGAYDYMLKPVSRPDLLGALGRAIEKRGLERARRRLEAENREYQSELEKKVEDRTRQLEMIRSATIFGLAKLTEYRDYETGNHLERIGEYTRLLVRGLASREDLRRYLTPTYQSDLVESSVLHDIGKTAVPDAILLKPGKLTPEEFEIMKTHSVVGGDALTAMEAKTEGTTFLALGKQVAYHHHERWDGGGYPKKLAGDDIPLSARIVALADVYDAVTVKRIYRQTAMSHSEAAELIHQNAGTQFDPAVVEAFDRVEAEIRAVRQTVDGTDEMLSAAAAPCAAVS